MKITLQYDGHTLTDKNGIIVVFSGLVGIEEEEIKETKSLDTSMLEKLASSHTVEELVLMRRNGLI